MTVKRSLAGLAILPAVAVAAAACGGGSSPSAPAPAATASAPSTATVDMTNSDLGTILVDSSGRTLYLFEKDAHGGSMCTGACATNWPPLTVTGAPSAGAGIDGAKLGTTKRADGAMQVTYGGHPLYLFKGDTASGDTKGEAVSAYGADWYAVSPKGVSVEEKKSSGGGY